MKATISYGVTVNKGNYESARIDYTMEFDSATKTPEAAYKEVREFVEARTVLERSKKL